MDKKTLNQLEKTFNDLMKDPLNDQKLIKELMLRTLIAAKEHGTSDLKDEVSKVLSKLVD